MSSPIPTYAEQGWTTTTFREFLFTPILILVLILSPITVVVESLLFAATLPRASPRFLTPLGILCYLVKKQRVFLNRFLATLPSLNGYASPCWITFDP